MKNSTTNIPFTEAQRLKFLKGAQKEIDNRLLEIELGMPPVEYFRVHNFFGVRIRGMVGLR